MENTNNNSETPNSPQELFAMQKKCSCDTEDPLAFANFLDQVVLPEEDPSPFQTVKAMEMMLSRLVSYHFDVLENDELTPWQRKIWKDDYKVLSKALKCLRLINPD
jgi:hypothetical protein